MGSCPSSHSLRKMFKALLLIASTFCDIAFRVDGPAATCQTNYIGGMWQLWEQENTIDGGDLGDCNEADLGDSTLDDWRVTVLHKGLGGWICTWVQLNLDDGTILNCDVDKLLDNDNEITVDCVPI